MNYWIISTKENRCMKNLKAKKNRNKRILDLTPVGPGVTIEDVLNRHEFRRRRKEALEALEKEIEKDEQDEQDSGTRYGGNNL